MLKKTCALLFRPVDIASLVFLRVAFGLVMFYEVLRYFSYGWIERYYIRPDFHFKYYGFEWVEPWPDVLMYWHFVVLGALALMIAVGFYYRVASIFFALAFTYVFLLDQANYLNHFYLIILIAFLMTLLPVDRALSVDAARWPSLRSRVAPGWCLWIVRLQFEVLYIYAGLVKVNWDWLSLEPLRMWLGTSTHLWLIGPLLTEEWVVFVAAYGVIALHLIGAPMLLFRRTRTFAICAYFAFHLMNHFLFSIGIFPWVAMIGTLMFLDPDWPRQAAWRLRGLLHAAARPALGAPRS